MVRVDRVDLLRDVVDEGGVGVALGLQLVTAVTVLQAERRLVADVPHQHTGVVLVGVDPLGELGEHVVLVLGVRQVVHTAAAAGAAAGLEPEAGDHLDAVGRSRVEERLAGGVGAPGADGVDAHGLHVGHVLLRVGDRGAPGQTLDRIRRTVHRQLPVALRTGDLHDVAGRLGGGRLHGEQTAAEQGRRRDRGHEAFGPAGGGTVHVLLLAGGGTGEGGRGPHDLGERSPAWAEKGPLMGGVRATAVRSSRRAPHPPRGGSRRSRAGRTGGRP